MLPLSCLWLHPAVLAVLSDVASAVGLRRCGATAPARHRHEPPSSLYQQRRNSCLPAPRPCPRPHRDAANVAHPPHWAVAPGGHPPWGGRARASPITPHFGAALAVGQARSVHMHCVFAAAARPLWLLLPLLPSPAHAPRGCGRAGGGGGGRRPLPPPPAAANLPRVPAAGAAV